jgi:nicotinamide-nucleotide amidase
MSLLCEQALTTIATRLQARQAMLACAESCTGGWIAKQITDQPGCSTWFERGFVTYSNLAKHQLLGVPLALLAQQGAVSQPVAEAMALGAITHSAADYALAVTGIAGPEGGSVDKPVGTVWLAWAGPSEVSSQLAQFAGDREQVRQATVQAALDGLCLKLAD